jgi:hypothetical protein
VLGIEFVDGQQLATEAVRSRQRNVIHIQRHIREVPLRRAVEESQRMLRR